MITSPQDFAQFSSVVVENFNSTVSFNTDICIFIKRSNVENILARALGFSDISAIHQFLKSGQSIESNKVLSITHTDIINSGLSVEQRYEDSPFFDGANEEQEYAATIFLASLAAAVGRYEIPTLVTTSLEFQELYPEVIFNDDYDYADDAIGVTLCLDNHKLYPYKHGKDYHKPNRILLHVPPRQFVDHMVSRLNQPYAQHQLSSMQRHLHLVGFTVDNGYNIETSRRSSLERKFIAPSLRVNAFNYHLALLRMFVLYEPTRQTQITLDMLGEQAIAYLFANFKQPFQQLSADLPQHIALTYSDEKAFFEESCKILIMSLENSYRFSFDAYQTLTLPAWYKSLFKRELEIKESLGDDYCDRLARDMVITFIDKHQMLIELYRKKILITFIEPEYRIWLHYNQKYSYKNDELFVGKYSLQEDAKRYAIEYLTSREELEPDYTLLTNKEFSLNVIDISQYLNIDRDRILSCAFKGFSSCLDYEEKDELICYCNDCKWNRKIESYKQQQNIAYIAGSGLATVTLRTPMLFTKSTAM